MTDASSISSDYALRAYRDGDEAAIVEVLRRCHAHGWGDVAAWRWKHRNRPGFQPGDVRIAEAGGDAIACFHFALLPIKLEDGIEVMVSVDGDFAVLHEHRRAGIPLRLIDATDPELRARGAVLRGGFTSEELNERFYNRRFGQVFVPAVTTQYRKILGPGPLVPRVAALGERLLTRRRLRAALGRPIVVALDIVGFPACHLVLASTGFTLARGRAARSDWRLRLPYETLTTLADDPGTFARRVASGLLTGRVRIGGWLRGLPRLAGAALRFVVGR